MGILQCYVCKPYNIIADDGNLCMTFFILFDSKRHRQGADLVLHSAWAVRSTSPIDTERLMPYGDIAERIFMCYAQADAAL